jgi:AraC-like DNA-binding protein
LLTMSEVSSGSGIGCAQLWCKVRKHGSPYFSRTFKKALGMTLTDSLNKLRIEEARYVLDPSNESVAKIALSVGYSDPNYFSNVFTKLEHVTPHGSKTKKGERYIATLVHALTRAVLQVR